MSGLRSHLPATGCTLRLASSEDDYDSFRSLSLEYSEWLGVKLCFQGFQQEMADLPGCYSSPQGCIILASVPTGEGGHSTDVGCVAVRPFAKSDEPSDQAETTPPLSPDTCEMKRLFVKQTTQGAGVGRMLIARALQEAKAAGYKRMLLDTLERLSAANKLYESFGFMKRESYYHNPLDNVVFWEREL